MGTARLKVQQPGAGAMKKTTEAEPMSDADIRKDPLLDNADETEAVAWRWAILLAFSVNSFGNSFSFMDFNTVPSYTKQLFGYCANQKQIDDDTCGGDSFVNMTYGAILFAVLPAFFPVLAYIGKKNRLTTIIGFTFQCIGAWLRWVCCKMADGGNIDGGRAVALVSSACIGVGAAVVITSYSCLSQRWFEPHERTLATTIAVMSNYAGWCLGCVLIPYVVTSTDILIDMQLYQAFFMTAAYVLLLVCHRERPANTARVSFHEQLPGASHTSMFSELKTLFSNKQYCIQCFTFSVLAGVSFSVPGFGTTALEDLDLTDRESAWVNFSFVFSGVVTGTALGKLCTSAKQFPAILRGAFAATSVGLIAVLVLIAVQGSMSKAAIMPLLLIAMGVTGAASLGFIGIALSAAVETSHPVDGEYSGGSIEWLVQLWGGIFVFASADLTGFEDFMMVAVPTWLTTAMMFTIYRQEYHATGSLSEEHNEADDSYTGVGECSS